MLQIFGKLLLWIADVTVLSAALALIEIGIEKNHGWASSLNQHGWGKRLFVGARVLRLIDKPYVTTYHLLVFGAVLPIVLWAQYRKGALFALCSSRGTSHAMADLLFFLSAFLAICILEDFLWFAMNWHYPRSLHDLLTGNIWWHTRWITFRRSVKLPRVYVSVGLIAICLLAISFAA